MSVSGAALHRAMNLLVIKVANKLFDLLGQSKIILRQAAYTVSRQDYADPIPPVKDEIRVVVCSFGQIADTIQKSQGTTKIAASDIAND